MTTPSGTSTTSTRQKLKDEEDVVSILDKEDLKTGSDTATPPTKATGQQDDEDSKSSSKRRKLADPTGLGIIGYMMAFTPVALYFMSFGQTTFHSSTVSVGAFFMLGGMCLFIAGILDFILGETFGFLVYSSYGGFYASLGIIDLPASGIAASFSATGTNSVEGSSSALFADAMAIYLICWGVLTFVFLIASLRTNLALVSLFLNLGLALILLAVGYFQIGKSQDPTTIFKVGGAVGFVSCVSAWYVALGLVLASTDVPVRLPMGD